MTAVDFAPNTAFLDLPPAAITPSPQNPRRTFDPAALEELAASLRAHGMIEPVVVRRVDGGYELIAGERRWRASQLAGLATIPVRDLGEVDDATALRLALVENLQRVDLDPIEEAEGYRALNRVVGLTQKQIAESVHRSQPSVANAIRLLELPADVVELLRTRQLSPAHGVALARFKDFPAVASALATLAVEQHLTSHDLEDKLPLAWELRGRGVAVPLNWRIAPSCRESCPFGAFRSVTNSYSSEWCLRPSHAAELDAAAEAADRAQKDERIAAAAADGVAMVDPSTLDYRSYDYIYHPPPDGCTEACPCRRTAPSGSPFCIDHGRYQRLKLAATRAANRALRERQARLGGQLEARLASLDSVGIDELVLLGREVIDGFYPAKELVAIGARHGVPIPGDWGAYGHRGTNRGYVALESAPDAVALVRFLVEALLRREINSETDTSKRRAMWYLQTEEGA